MRNQYFVKLVLLFVCFGLWHITNAQIIEVNSIKCFGDSTGELGVYPDFGGAPYTYLWSTGQTSQIIDGLPSGNYLVTVTDSGGVNKIYTYVLLDPPPVTATFTLAPNSSWPVYTGSILINATGGTGWYNYSIYDSLSTATTNQADPLFGGLPSGSYYVTISDLYNCQYLDTVKLLEIAALPVAITIDTTACYMSTAPTNVRPDLGAVYPVIVNYDNINTFTILDTVTGPRPYLMSTPGDTLGNIGGQFEPGFHIVWVFSADGKGFRYSWTVDSVVAPISIAFTNTNNICFGNHTASISSLAQGSWMGFSYHISGPNGFSANSSSANGLYAGQYTITATDYTGCSLNQGVYISQPDEPLRIVFDDPTNPRCPYSADGMITIHLVDGAFGTIAYQWETGENVSFIDSLYPGTYSVIVTDENNCTVEDSIRLKADRRGCIFNIVTPNGDGYNDYLDLTDICKDLQMQATIFDEAGKLIATLDELNPRWDASDPAKPPTGASSSYTVFIELTKGGEPYMKWSEGFSVIYPN